MQGAGMYAREKPQEEKKTVKNDQKKGKKGAKVRCGYF